MLCAPVKTDSLEAVDEASRKGDLIELRLDLFCPKDLRKLRAACRKPVIFKLQKFDPKVLEFKPDWVDLPFGVSVDLPVRRICSYHDTQQTPDLPELYQKLRSCPADLYKIATHARSSHDALRMLQFARKNRVLGLCMGERGAVSRILAPVFGVPWTYAPVSEEQTTASGQVLIEDLVNTYRYRTLSPKTALYGLIGDPVSKSVSHKTHNFAFDQLGLDAVYVKMPVAPEEVSPFLSLAEEAGFKGLSVTMPLKECICPGGAYNTIAFRGGKRLFWNTDGAGALDALEKLGPVRDKRMVILGAGGAAHAIVQEAQKRGADVAVANRTPSRAQKIDAARLALEEVASFDYDILINCTPTCPIPPEQLLEKRIVMDIVTRPKMTPLLQIAQNKGCKLVYGLDMFIQQAVGQYCYWFLDEKLDDQTLQT